MKRTLITCVMAAGLLLAGAGSCRGNLVFAGE